jgi:hypothetical protein
LIQRLRNINKNMFITGDLVIFFLIICLLISFLLIKIVRDHIHNQSVGSITVIDLTYADCLAVSFCFGIIYSSGIIGCLISEDLTLNFFPSLILGEAMFVSVFYIMCAFSITGQLNCHPLSEITYNREIILRW